MSAPSPLLGRQILVTREDPGRLSSMLEERGAMVVHVPLISVIEAADHGAELRANLARLDEFDWLVVTSAAGASRVGDAARHHPAVRLAAVGARTAAVLSSAADRPVDLVPDDQHGAALADLLAVQSSARLLLAVADRAPTTLAASLVAAGHCVTTVTAYQTIFAPARADDADVIDTDALLLASGSAAEAWVERFGVSHPPVVVVIGPSTATVAARMGLKVSGVATDHSLTGLVIELERCFKNSASAE